MKNSLKVRIRILLLTYLLNWTLTIDMSDFDLSQLLLLGAFVAHTPPPVDNTEQ